MPDFLCKVWGLTRAYRSRLLLGVLAGIVGGLLEPLMIAVVTFVYSVIFPSANTPDVTVRLKWAPAALRETVRAAHETLHGGVQSHPWAIILLIGAIPAVVLLRGVFAYLNVYCLQWAAVRTIADLRLRLFEHLVNLPAAFFSRANTGELMSRIMNDTAALQSILSSAVGYLVKDPVTLAGLLAYLLWQQPRITLISLIVLPLCAIPIAIYNRKARQSSRAMQAQMAQLGGVLAESLTGIPVIKAYNLEPTVVEQFRRAAAQYVRHGMRLVRSAETPGPLLEFVGALGLAVVLIYLARSPSALPDSADFLAILLAIYAMYRPLKNLTRLHNQLHQAQAATERIFELLATTSDLPEPAVPKPCRAAGAAVQFDNVDFAYGNKPVLRGVNLTIQPGQMVALVGQSGSGKTTLANLLLRFYDPQRGAVRIGGTDIREFSTRDLRSQIAVVTQETVLFNDTIRRNIELGRPGASAAEIEAAARHANAHDFIMQHPQGYDTVVGEKGVILSGGERQRLAIARAILKNAPILVLDEATSSLDTESERAVQAALDELMRGRTTLCIAHRLSTVQKADVIVVLDQGRIVETGSHAELLQRNGLYARFYSLQFSSGSNTQAGLHQHALGDVGSLDTAHITATGQNASAQTRDCV